MEGRTNGEMLKVLVVDEEIPYPPDAGKRIRTWNLLKRLAQKHCVHLLCYGRAEDSSSAALRSAGIVLHLVEPPQELTGYALYLRLLANVFSPYPFSVAKHYSRRFQRVFDDLLKGGDWDLVQCEWTPYARFVSSAGNTPTLIATHNVESQIWERRAEHSTNVVERAFFRLQERKMTWFERRALRRATAVTAVTSADAQTMRDWGVRAVTLVPNGVDPEFYVTARDLEVDSEILSVASLDWFPNADALEYFAYEIFPLIREKLPTAVLRIVGRRPPESLKLKLSRVPGIDFVGEVKDVRPYLDRSSVIVVPLRIGGGSRLKILEALAAGKAVVSTSIGAEGLELDSEKHLLIADSSGDFARRVAELLLSREARRNLGDNGRKLVTERYGWNGIADRLESAWLDISRQSHPKTSVSAVARAVQGTP
jgi:glycosyltransferase involved in cell wall biosynthesis